MLTCVSPVLFFFFLFLRGGATGGALSCSMLSTTSAIIWLASVQVLVTEKTVFFSPQRPDSNWLPGWSGKEFSLVASLSPEWVWHFLSLSTMVSTPSATILETTCCELLLLLLRDESSNVHIPCKSLTFWFKAMPFPWASLTLASLLSPPTEIVPVFTSCTSFLKEPPISLFTAVTSSTSWNEIMESKCHWKYVLINKDRFRLYYFANMQQCNTLAIKRNWSQNLR